MNRNEANKIAETISADDLIQMLVNAQNNIKDWTQVSTVNPIMTKGTAFNIFTKGSISDKLHVMAKVNMLREFGEFLPNYEKQVKSKRELPTPVHQEPIFIKQSQYK